MEAFAPSRSPALTGLLEAARICFEDPEKLASSHLKEHLRHVAEARRHLDAQYGHNAKIRPRTPLFLQLDPQVRKQFEEFRQGLKQVERFLESRQPEELRAGCARARAAVDSLLDLLARLREEEEGFPVYSDSPFIHELTHLALGVAKGDIPPEILRTRLESFREQVRRTLADYREWSQSKPENAAVGELLPQLEKGLRALAQGLEEMNRFFSDGNKERLRRGGEVILKAGVALQTLQQRLNSALVPSPVCPRCSRQNPPGTRICEGCQSRLPEVESSPTSMEIRLGGESEPPRFAYVVRVEEAVEGYLQGTGSDKELKSTLEWFSQRVSGGRAQLSALKPPERFPSVEVEQHARALRKRLEQASGRLAEGAQRMLDGLSSQDRGQLAAGLELVREGAAEMGSVQAEMPR